MVRPPVTSQTVSGSRFEATRGGIAMAQDRAPYSLRGQKVVIVGGTSGMGLGAARAAAEAGAEVVIAGRRPEAARPTGDGEKDRFAHAVVDITDEPSIRRLFDGVGDLDH